MEITKIHGRKSVSFEKITISTAAKGFTSSKILPTSGDYINIGCRETFVTLEDADIRFTLDGTPPTTDLGHILMAGESLTIKDPDDISNFRAIRDGDVDGVLMCTYKF